MDSNHPPSSSIAIATAVANTITANPRLAVPSLFAIAMAMNDAPPVRLLAAAAAAAKPQPALRSPTATAAAATDDVVIDIGVVAAGVAGAAVATTSLVPQRTISRITALHASHQTTTTDDCSAATWIV